MTDEIGNLYRAAFYIAKGAKEVGLKFLKNSGEKFRGLKLETEKEKLFWAEKILDKYVSLKHAS
ncbi:MAG: hypothetical protein UU32_C0011G0003 [Candidatus Woesebacteria bacterium GW2011_GWB1_41_10]|uniref:Uncharacterized protein n=1 Tax=Candidatus Woesebacteria bacterium GW2011_GWB1_41_10 TaxID=1618577 RepID=A0A0G0UCR6_9BACT|nr:MAG: hypothetical protein UU32_C0011G0003 [Candidatus Woesebacteria bacterium GW2011_GWB1_41_10]